MEKILSKSATPDIMWATATKKNNKNMRSSHWITENFKSLVINKPQPPRHESNWASIKALMEIKEIYAKKVLLGAITFICLIGFSACKDDIVEPPTYPITIPYEEYFIQISGTHYFCEWDNWKFFWDYENFDGYSTSTVINSDEELENYIRCYEANYPEIDFSKYSLILVNGYYPHGCTPKYLLLQQTSVNEYQLDIEISYVVEFEESCKWVVALIVDKLPEDNNIKVNLTFYKFFGE